MSSNGRPLTPGKTRSCPHCKAIILETATVCPGCQHHLRFDPAATQRVPGRTPLKVEGAIRPPAGGGACEYSVVLSIRNARGEEINRQVVGVGAIQPGDERTFTLSVEMFAAAEVREPRTATSESTATSGSRWTRPPATPAPERRVADGATEAPSRAAAPARPPWPAPAAATPARAPAPSRVDPRPPATPTDARGARANPVQPLNAPARPSSAVRPPSVAPVSSATRPSAAEVKAPAPNSAADRAEPPKR